MSFMSQFSAKEYKEALEVLEFDYNDSKAMDITGGEREEDNKVLLSMFW